MLLLVPAVCIIGVDGAFSITRHAGRNSGEARRN